jgi:hypothetical protein
MKAEFPGKVVAVVDNFQYVGFSGRGWDEVESFFKKCGKFWVEM